MDGGFEAVVGGAIVATGVGLCRWPWDTPPPDFLAAAVRAVAAAGAAGCGVPAAPWTGGGALSAGAAGATVVGAGAAVAAGAVGVAAFVVAGAAVVGTGAVAGSVAVTSIVGLLPC